MGINSIEAAYQFRVTQLLANNSNNPLINKTNN